MTSTSFSLQTSANAPWLFNSSASSEIEAYTHAWSVRSHEPLPRILHQTWRSCALPSVQARLRARCVRLLGGSSIGAGSWQLPFWTDSDNDAFVREAFPSFYPTYRKYSLPIKRADAVRYLYLWKFGGVYMDVDSSCLRHLDALELAPAEAVFSYQHGAKKAPDAVANAFMAAPAGHPFLAFLLSRLEAAAAKPVQVRSQCVQVSVSQAG